MANFFSVARQYSDIWSHKIFGVPRRKIKGIGLGYSRNYNDSFLFCVHTFVSFLLMWGRYQKCPLESDPGVDNVTQSAIVDLGV